MKQATIFLLASLLFVITSCHKEDIAANTPDCIRSEIVSNSNNLNWMMKSVDEYLFQNKLVYAFSPDHERIADASTAIKDEFCNTLCDVGGWGGNICNGVNFSQTAVFKRNIWKK
jgi:hypothetical protein